MSDRSGKSYRVGVIGFAHMHVNELVDRFIATGRADIVACVDTQPRTPSTITVDGSLRDIKVISGSPLLREEALAAAKQWRYSPYLLGGKPVQTETRITMNFNR